MLVQPAVLVVCCDAVRDRVGPANKLKLGRDLAVILVGMVTAVAADDLVCVGVAAFRLAATMRAGWRLRTKVQPSPG